MSGSLENIAWDQRLARILVRPLARTSVHPNAITTLGLMMGLLAGYLFAQGDPVLANWAAGVFMFAAFVDHADGELARLVAAIDGVLEDKNRRLSNLLVERVLEGNNDQRLGDFITIVQASDLSALSNTLNEDLLAFIRQLLV